MRVRSPRGALEGPARIGAIRAGVVFVPFHYGYWDARTATHRARGQRADADRLGPGLQAAALQGRRRRCGAGVMQLAHYLGLLHRAQARLADGFRAVGDGHAEEPDVRILCERLAGRCDGHVARLEPFDRRYGEAEGRRARRPCTASCSTARAAAGSGCCATSTTSTSWPQSARSPGPSSGRRRRGCATRDLPELAAAVRGGDGEAARLDRRPDEGSRAPGAGRGMSTERRGPGSSCARSPPRCRWGSWPSRPGRSW